MANYNLYFNLPNQGLPFKKIVTITVNDNMSVFGLLDIVFQLGDTVLLYCQIMDMVVS